MVRFQAIPSQRPQFSASRMITRGQPTFDFDRILVFAQYTLCCHVVSRTFHLFIRPENQRRAPHHESEQPSLGPFACFDYRLLSKHGPWVNVDRCSMWTMTVHTLHRSTSSTMIPF